MAPQRLPESGQAERVVLQAALSNPAECIGTILRDVPAECVNWFSTMDHRHVFAAVVDAWEGNRCVGPDATIASLKRLEFDSPEVERLVYELYSSPVPRAWEVVEAVQAVRVAGVRRELAARARALQAGICDGTASMQDAAEAVLEMQRVVAVGSSSDSEFSFDSVLNAEVAREIESADGGVVLRPRRLTTITGLDNAIGGFEPGDLVLLAGTTGSGKSSIAAQLANYAVSPDPDDRYSVLYVTLEMTRMQMMRRLKAMVSGVPDDLYGRKRLSAEQKAMVRQADRYCKTNKLEFWEPRSRHGRTPAGIAAMVRYKCQTSGHKLVVVDHLQRVCYPKKVERWQAFEDFMVELATLANELGITVLIVGQFNRDYHKRSATKPKLSDIRDSGGIEHNVHVALLINFPNEDGSRPYEPRDLCELHVAKNRNGPRGRIVTGLFKGDVHKFVEVGLDYEELAHSRFLPLTGEQMMLEEERITAERHKASEEWHSPPAQAESPKDPNDIF